MELTIVEVVKNNIIYLIILVSNVALNALLVRESLIIVILVGLDFIHYLMPLNALSVRSNVLHVIV